MVVILKMSGDMSEAFPQIWQRLSEDPMEKQRTCIRYTNDNGEKQYVYSQEEMDFGMWMYVALSEDMNTIKRR